MCKNRFEKFARIFSRRHKQTLFSDACFLGVLRANGFLFYNVPSRAAGNKKFIQIKAYFDYKAALYNVSQKHGSFVVSTLTSRARGTGITSKLR